MKIRKLNKLIILVSVYSVAMGFLESAVVVYLREIYYPSGFNFPLVPIDYNIAFTEFLREVATVIMLLTIGYLAANTFSTRFAWFIYSFAIWDIFYYIFLALLLNWPESIMTNDILFLIPVVWIGPVITPIIVSLTMILLALSILIFDNKRIAPKIFFPEWAIFTIGSIAIIIGFSWDYAKFLIENYSLSAIWSLSSKTALFGTSEKFVPRQFNWFMFILGEIIILLGIVKYIFRIKKAKLIRKNSS